MRQQFSRRMFDRDRCWAFSFRLRASGFRVYVGFRVSGSARVPGLDKSRRLQGL